MSVRITKAHEMRSLLYHGCCMGHLLSIVERKYISIKAVNDERICDGFYYASAFKYIKSLFRSPELLDRIFGSFPAIEAIVYN